MTLWLFEHVICFTTPYSRSFVAPRCSSAYCLRLLGILALVFLPILAAFASDNVWVKESSYREQPHVSFAHDLFVLLAGDTAADAVGWSTREELAPLLPSQVHPSVRASEVDENHDGVPDKLKLSIGMPTGDVRKGYRYMLLMAVYNYQLQHKVHARMAGLLVADVSCPYSATGVWLRGELRLRQRLPLRTFDETRDVYAQNPLSVDWSSSWAAQNHPVSVRSIFDRYYSRNETVNLFLTAPPVWDYAPRDRFEAQVVLEVPPQPVFYVPGALEVLKFAWMQVLSFLIPAWALVRAVQAFAFENQVVETFVVPQLPPKGAG